MLEQSVLNDFLQKASRGGQFDSEGGFTLSEGRALARLSQSQLPRPELWVLKIVQAAVRSGTEKITITRDKRTTFFRFFPEELISLEDLADSFLRTKKSPPPLIGHLQIGLRAVGFAQGRHFTLGFDQGRERFLLAWNGERLVRGEEVLPKAVSRPTFYLGVAHGQDPGPSGQEVLRAEEFALRENCEVCGVPISFNGVRLDNFLAPLVDPGHGLGQRVVLSAGWGTSPSKVIPLLRRPEALNLKGRRNFSDRFADSKAFAILGDRESKDVGYLMKLSYGFHVDGHRSSLGKFRFHSKPRFSYIHWVRDGVVCDRHKWKSEPSPVSFDIYLSAEGLPTDISSLKIIRRSDVGQRIAAVLPQVSEQAIELASTLRSTWPRPFAYHAVIAGVFSFLAVTNPAAVLFQVLAGGFAATQLAISVFDKHQVMMDAVRHLEKLAEELEN